MLHVVSFTIVLAVIAESVPVLLAVVTGGTVRTQSGSEITYNGIIRRKKG